MHRASRRLRLHSHSQLRGRAQAKGCKRLNSSLHPCYKDTNISLKNANFLPKRVYALKDVEFSRTSEKTNPAFWSFPVSTMVLNFLIHRGCSGQRGLRKPLQQPAQTGVRSWALLPAQPPGLPVPHQKIMTSNAALNQKVLSHICPEIRNLCTTSM